MDVIQKIAVGPLQPLLRPIVAFVPQPVHDDIASLIGSSCHNALLVNLDVAQNPQCTSLAISKVLGIAIVGASGIVKLPQILKLIGSGSSAGVSFVSYALETASLLITLSYGVRNQFPFSTYGESAFIAAQDVLVGVLVLSYAGRSAAAAAFIAVVAASVYSLLVDTSFVDAQTMAYLQAGAGALGVASKVPQILTIWQEGGTGQLSAFAVSLDSFSFLWCKVLIDAGVQLPRRLHVPYLHYPPGGRRQAHSVRISRRLLSQPHSCHADVVLLEQLCFQGAAGRARLRRTYQRRRVYQRSRVTPANEDVSLSLSSISFSEAVWQGPYDSSTGLKAVCFHFVLLGLISLIC